MRLSTLSPSLSFGSSWGCEHMLEGRAVAVVWKCVPGWDVAVNAKQSQAF